MGKRFSSVSCAEEGLESSFSWCLGEGLTSCLLALEPKPNEARKERGDFGAFSEEGVLLDRKPLTSSLAGLLFFLTLLLCCNGVALVTLAAVLCSFVNCVPLLTGKGGTSSSGLADDAAFASRNVFTEALLYLLLRFSSSSSCCWLLLFAPAALCPNALAGC